MLPKPLYEALPALYLMAGFLCVYVLQSPFALISTIMFVLASVMVIMMRRSYRRQLAQG